MRQQLLLCFTVLTACQRNFEKLKVPDGGSLALQSPGSVAPRERLQLNASGGRGHYLFRFSGNTGSGLDATLSESGEYQAGSNGLNTDIVEVSDGSATVQTRISVGANLQLRPQTTIIAPGGTLAFTASGGKPPYQFVLGAGGVSGSKIDAGTGAYLAGIPVDVGTDSITLTDATFESGDTTAQSAVASVRLSDSLRLFSSGTRAVAPSEGVRVFAIGGAPPYRYAFAPSGNASGGSVDALTGDYVAGTSGDVTDTLVVIDSNAVAASLQMSIGPQLLLQVINPSVTAFSHTRLVASGGKPPYSYGFARVGNRSFGSIDPSSGLYTVGGNSPVIDITRVTDATGASVSLPVSVSSQINLRGPDDQPPQCGAIDTDSDARDEVFSVSIGNSAQNARVTLLAFDDDSAVHSTQQFDIHFQATATAMVTTDFDADGKEDIVFEDGGKLAVLRNFTGESLVYRSALSSFNFKGALAARDHVVYGVSAGFLACATYDGASGPLWQVNELTSSESPQFLSVANFAAGNQRDVAMIVHDSVLAVYFDFQPDGGGASCTPPAPATSTSLDFGAPVLGMVAGVFDPTPAPTGPSSSQQIQSTLYVLYAGPSGAAHLKYVQVTQGALTATEVPLDVTIPNESAAMLAPRHIRSTSPSINEQFAELVVYNTAIGGSRYGTRIVRTPSGIVSKSFQLESPDAFIGIACVTAAKIDEDAMLDLFVVDVATTSTVLRGDMLGQFDRPHFSVDGSSSAGTRDVDGDGDLDTAICSTTQCVSLFSDAGGFALSTPRPVFGSALSYVTVTAPGPSGEPERSLYAGFQGSVLASTLSPQTEVWSPAAPVAVSGPAGGKFVFGSAELGGAAPGPDFFGLAINFSGGLTLTSVLFVLDSLTHITEVLVQPPIDAGANPVGNCFLLGVDDAPPAPSAGPVLISMCTGADINTPTTQLTIWTATYAAGSVSGWQHWPPFNFSVTATFSPLDGNNWFVKADEAFFIQGNNGNGIKSEIAHLTPTGGSIIYPSFPVGPAGANIVGTFKEIRVGTKNDGRHIVAARTSNTITILREGSAGSFTAGPPIAVDDNTRLMGFGRLSSEPGVEPSLVIGYGAHRFDVSTYALDDLP